MASPEESSEHNPLTLQAELYRELIEGAEELYRENKLHEKAIADLLGVDPLELNETVDKILNARRLK